MEINRRHTLSLLGSALAAPYTLRSANAEEAGVAYVKVCDVQGAGFFYIPGSDIALSDNGIRASWLNWPNNSFVDGKAYTRLFDYTGASTSGPVQLGNPAGPTDGSRPNSISNESFGNGKGITFFGAPSIGATPSAAQEIYSQIVSKGGVEIGKPVQVNAKTEGGFGTLRSTDLSNGNFALAYTADLGDGLSVAVHITDPDGKPVGAEKTAAKGSDSTKAAIATGLAANNTTIFVSFAEVGGGETKFGVQRLDFGLRKLGTPTWIVPPSGKDILGRPDVIPGTVREFRTFYETVTGTTPQADLYSRDYTASGAAGALKHLGSHAIDDTSAALLDGPNSLRTASGDYLVFTDGVGALTAWHIDRLLKKIIRTTFRRRRARKLRQRRLRMRPGVFIPASPHHTERARAEDVYALLWHEIDESVSPTQTTWHAEVFTIQPS
jgi:hypothetical protein